MEYPGPEPADLVNVNALNRAFLDWQRARRPAGRLPEDVAATLAGLDGKQRERLARAPFLLLSLREHDADRWQSYFSENRNLDLLGRVQAPDPNTVSLIAAALGFLWQLAKRNPYAARLVSGVSVNWCEQLSESTLIELYTKVVADSELLAPRMADNHELWRKLLTAGVSARREVRTAARVSALQTVLTRNPERAYRRLAAAACRMPAARVAVRSRR